MSCLNLAPLKWDWPDLKRGDTLPASIITETTGDTILSRVRITIKSAATGLVALTLDSTTSGVTITTATAGAWDFTIGPITAATTETLTEGFYSYELESFDPAGTVRTEFEGSWKII